tara:strand:- start:762 stop:941 length:180 start_codon:yes stop_codon:yes gene_type:complete
MSKINKLTEEEVMSTRIVCERGGLTWVSEVIDDKTVQKIRKVSPNLQFIKTKWEVNDDS